MVTTQNLCLPSDRSSPDPTRARLDSLIQDIISDHGLEGPDTESAGDFTRNVGLLCCATAVLLLSQFHSCGGFAFDN